jgi:hypothetical protein
MDAKDRTEWEEEGYVEKENGTLEKEVVNTRIHKDTCSLWFSLYHVGNKEDYNEWPDGSWYEMEISNAANASLAVTNTMRFYPGEKGLDSMLEFIMEAKPLLKKHREDLENL